MRSVLCIRMKIEEDKSCRMKMIQRGPDHATSQTHLSGHCPHLLLQSSGDPAWSDTLSGYVALSQVSSFCSYMYFPGCKKKLERRLQAFWKEMCFSFQDVKRVGKAGDETSDLSEHFKL